MRRYLTMVALPVVTGATIGSVIVARATHHDPSPIKIQPAATVVAPTITATVTTTPRVAAPAAVDVAPVSSGVTTTPAVQTPVHVHSQTQQQGVQQVTNDVPNTDPQPPAETATPTQPDTENNGPGQVDDAGVLRAPAPSNPVHTAPVDPKVEYPTPSPTSQG